MKSKNDKYPSQIQFSGLIWLISNYISMKHGMGTVKIDEVTGKIDEGNTQHFDKERHVMRGIDILRQYDFVSPIGFKSYLRSPLAQESYEVHVKDNHFYDSKGNNMNGEYIFVLTCEKEPKILCCKEGELLHSYLANGKKVLAAGTLSFKNGVLTEMSNNSGHYRPTDEEMLLAIKAFHIASGGSLEKYTSHSNENLKIYFVEALAKCATFSEAQPLENGATNTIERRFDKPLNPKNWARILELHGFLKGLLNNDPEIFAAKTKKEQEANIGYAELSESAFNK